MKRTQVMLEEWQLESLRARARRRSSSVSAIVREAVNEYLSLSGILDGVERIAGIGDAAEVSGRDHDRWLSGEKKES